jgi:hypothetical protein
MRFSHGNHANRKDHHQVASIAGTPTASSASSSTPTA